MGTQPDGERLAGGMANAGAVFRRGAVVDRPASRNAAGVHAYLAGLRERGFDGAPVGVGLDGGREQLTYVEGDVALPPFPGWVVADGALRSVGRLLRRLHDAAAGVGFDPAADWDRVLADPAGGPVLCHNDVCPKNVVFRDGQAVALIDFDLAAPGRPLWDVAMTARYWVPTLDPESAAVHYPAGLDQLRRLRLLADAYGLTPAERRELPAVIEQATAAGRAFVERRFADGDPAYTEAVARHGGWTRWDRMQAWLVTHRDAYAAALRD
ncbi:phosphotransferase [Actinacidiphila paucisporea]|uniref:Phosphotransferase enzyme family protein n=1 Tax=Actinacidiphila paucisporea TaxID=310782 RepID=A0A1M6YUH9_9ACTN|nr:phosphotransferase [Actinacidiphila paucisporea]SHL21898.1 Phosphotransferase enzyme family protein [Actinacidiphila paucisporea]